jgi:hypothetical protein
MGVAWKRAWFGRGHFCDPPFEKSAYAPDFFEVDQLGGKLPLHSPLRLIPECVRLPGLAAAQAMSLVIFP